MSVIYHFVVKYESPPKAARLFPAFISLLQLSCPSLAALRRVIVSNVFGRNNSCD